MTWHYPLVFLTGAAVLILEILGARLISPFFGATIYVWSAVITVTLAALAVGYALGGGLADKRRPLVSLCWMLGLSGCWVLVLPLLRRPVLLASSSLGVQLGALVGAAVLFALPLACLGAVGPLCIRLRTREIGRLGREVGGVTAVSTVGSVLGALLAGFYLIPQLPVGRLLAGLALLLLALTAFCAWKTGRSRVKGVSVVLLTAALGAGAASLARAVPEGSGDVRIREVGKSFYGAVKVVDRLDWGRRVLYIDGIANTVVDLKDLDSTSDYITSFELLPLMRPKARRALLIGLGGGSLVGRFARDYGIVTDVVEIDPAVNRLSRKWFGFKPSGRVIIDDGRRYMARTGETYDLVVIDAFNGDRHPIHLFTEEAFRLAKKRLAPGGVLSINLIGYGYGPKAKLRHSVARTLREVFSYVRVLAANKNLDIKSSFLNLTYFASDEAVVVGEAPGEAPDRVRDYYAVVKGRFLDMAGTGSGIILTDDYNPIEAMSAPAFLAIRERLMEYNLEVLAS